jgi:penicillin-binding protein 1A
MSPASRPAKAARILLIVAVVAAIFLGVSTGAALAATRNARDSENFSTPRLNLPSRIYDIRGRLITEFFSDEKREIVSIKDLPKHLIDAVVTREDQSFYKHHGFTFRGIFRAAWGVLTRTSRGGGSTITQQLAGTLLDIRGDLSIKRKIVELWSALQLERRYTKEEILEMYLNRMVMGPGVYGVEAASKYFFGHSAKEDSLAESAILAIQLSSPAKYDPYKNPQNASARSLEILNQMVRNGYADKAEAEASYREFWDAFDYTRTTTSAYNRRGEYDKAPWFSEYVRRQLEDMLYGSLDLYNDGLIVNTTLDLDQQERADYWMALGINQVNRTYQAESSQNLGGADRTYIPVVELLGLGFDLEDLFVSSAKIKGKTYDYFQKRINPTIDAAAILFGLPALKAMANAGSGRVKSELAKTTVEGALITIEQDTGHITALVGGSRFDEANQLIRATQARLMPGSSFKPLYYSAAIDTRKFTEATLIYDEPVVFYNEDGTPYTPLDYKGKFMGPVLTWYALAQSMNVPSLKILDSIGFDAAIDRAAALLSITDPEEIRRTFPRVYPLGLGVIGVSPLSMARAFSVFANQGREVTPIAIRSVEDRNGRVILEPEKDLRTQQKKKGSGIQIVSQQNAAVMVDMLGKVVRYGTLSGWTGGGTYFSYTDSAGKKYTIPAAGKTGTTQNWADAWTVGFTPYYTTAIWYGFDRPGNSLGTTQSGATVAGFYWANYMKDINKNLPAKTFQRPQSGLVEATVCSVTGLLPTPYCTDGTTTLLFYEGTQPNKLCEWHSLSAERDRTLIDKLGGQIRNNGDGARVDSTLRVNIPGLNLGGNAPGSAPGGAEGPPLAPAVPQAGATGEGQTAETPRAILD